MRFKGFCAAVFAALLGTAGHAFGQAYRPGMPWPRQNLTSFSRLLDYENSASREEAVRTRAEPNGGGALPLMGAGEQRTTLLLRGTHAWNLVGTTPTAAPLAVDGRIHEIRVAEHAALDVRRAAPRGGGRVGAVQCLGGGGSAP